MQIMPRATGVVLQALVTAMSAVFVFNIVGCSASLLGTPKATTRRTPETSPESGTKPADSPHAAPTLKGLLPIYSTSDDPAAVVAKWDQWNVRKAYVMYQSDIDPKRTNRWTAKDLTYRWLGKNVPEDFDGPICLDWENDVLEILSKGPENNPEWQPVVTEMVQLLQFVKSKRPKAKIGYYALPQTKYWNQDQVYQDRMLALHPIYKESTALFPSAYDFYGENPERDKAAFATIMRLALRCADGKPVYPFVWHRYHDSTPQWGFKRIPGDEFVDHVRNLVHTEYNSDRIDGIMAWGQERYWYTSSHQRNADGAFLKTGTGWDRIRERFATEVPAGQTFDAFYEQLLNETYCRLAEAANDVPCVHDR